MPAVRQGLENEDAVLGLIGRQVGVVAGGAEGVVEVVGPGLELSGRDDDPLAGESGGHGLAPLGRVAGLLRRFEVVPLGVAPAAAHPVLKLFGDASVEPVLATLDRLVGLAFLAHCRAPPWPRMGTCTDRQPRAVLIAA